MFNLAVPSGQVQPFPGALLQDGISPTPLTANVNDYNPAGPDGQVAGLLCLSAAIAVSITGLQGGLRFRKLDIYVRPGSSTITLEAEDVGSAAANRFGFASDVALAANSFATLLYDPEAQRWFLQSATAVGGNGGVSQTLFEPLGLAATGFAGGATVTSNAVKIGRMATLILSADGTSNANSFGFTGLPADLFPLANIVIAIRRVDNGSTGGGLIQITSAGAISLSSSFALVFNNWTAAGTKVLEPLPISYMTAT